MAENLEKLLSHLRGRTKLAQAVVEADGKTYFITHPASASALFDEEEFEKDESIPYWADLWPSAIALAKTLSSMEFAGKRIIELGCGVGLPSVVALERGADEVVATDYYAEALDFASHNANVNVGRGIGTALLDWNEPELDGVGTFDLVLAADILYERKNARILAEVVSRLLSPGGVAILADPRRPGAKLFIKGMDKKGFRRSQTTVTVEQGGREVVVNLHSFQGRDRVSGACPTVFPET